MKASSTDASRADLIDRIGRQIGTSVPPTRRRAVETALLEVAERRGVAGISDLYHRLGVDRELTEEVVSTLTVGETYFFRDPDQFELIRTTIIPDLLDGRAAESPLRIWCAGCSSGEEPYSLAIMMETEGLGERARIVATDISQKALRAARKAEYSGWSLRKADPSLLSHFTATGNRYRLDRRIVGRVEFIRHRLGADHGPPVGTAGGQFDLILCRNVLMYMEQAAVARAAQQFHALLAEGGWLLTGPSDPALWTLAPFEAETTSSGVAYRPCRPSERAVVRRSAEESLNAVAPTAASGVGRYPLSAERHYRHGLEMIDSGDHKAAFAALRRSIGLDRTLEAPRFRLAVCLGEHNPEAARRELRRAQTICATRRSDEEVPLMDGITAGAMTEMIEQELLRLRLSGGGQRR